MKLERLVLTNFRQYYKRQMLEFSKSPQRHVTVIHGINGAGKTSMFLAMNWCLYGREVIDNVGELICKEALAQAQIGDLVEMSVELTFTHDGQRYVMKRTASAPRQFDGEITAYEHDEVVLNRIGMDGERQKETSPLSVINAILPANVRTYFLFDGEKIDEFAKPEAAGEVREAIYLVLRLEVLDRARSHLTHLSREYRSELVKATGDETAAKLETALRELEAEQEKTQNRLAEVRREIELAKKRIEEIDQQLNGMAAVRTLHQERKQVEEGLKKNRESLQQLITGIQEEASRGYLLQGAPIIEQALHILEEKRIRGQIPSNIRQRFVQDLLDHLVCICGRGIEQESPEYQNLHKLLVESVPSSLEEEVLQTNDLLRGLQVQAKSQGANLQRLMQERVQTTDQITQLEGRLGDLEIELKGSSIEDVAKLERQRKTFWADIESNAVTKGTLDGRLETLKKEIAGKGEQLEQMRKNSAKAQHLARKQSLAQGSAQAIDAIYDRFADEMRQQIENKTNEIFRLLAWKEEHFAQITLNSDYELEIVDRYGKGARAELSAGERQVLSLSFIAAMAQVSDEEAPLVMDTPFGRLSSHHRNSITKNLPQLASQMVLFVTDEELRDEARRNIEPYIGAEYRLNFDAGTSCTQIEEL
ncbi:MAG: AAA family ATPase [Caldilineaceae bacterium]